MTNPSQSWNPELYDREHSYVYGFGEDLLGILLPVPGERILDVGCGNGHLTRRIADSGASVTGIDQSDEMIRAAKTAYPRLEFIRADARDFTFPQPFDAVFSNAALHWIPEADAEMAVVCMSRALKPGGRFVAEFGGRGNIAAVRRVVEATLAQLGKPLAGSPWYFPAIGEYASLLERHDLLVRSAWLFDRPTPLDSGGEGLRGWLEMFGGRMLGHLDSEEREFVIRRAEEELRPLLYKSGRWTIDYRRLRIVAAKVDSCV